MAEKQVITPWEVNAGDKAVDYDALIKNFGSQPITDVKMNLIYRNY